jgi:hypothetical protein
LYLLWNPTPENSWRCFKVISDCSVTTGTSCCNLLFALQQSTVHVSMSLQHEWTGPNRVLLGQSPFVTWSSRVVLIGNSTEQGVRESFKLPNC